jgi:AraC-like DNA-binding protein
MLSFSQSHQLQPHHAREAAFPHDVRRAHDHVVCAARKIEFPSVCFPFGFSWAAIYRRQPCSVYPQDCLIYMECYHPAMKTPGIALPDLHMQVLYFGSRRLMNAVRRTARPAACWTLHWNQTHTATVAFGGRHWRLGPESLSLTAPRTVCEETLAPGEEHTYLHFVLGPRYDRVQSRVLVLPADGPVRELLKTLSDSYRRKNALEHGDAFGIHALICLVLREIPESFWPSLPTDPRIRRTLQTLDERFNEEITNPVLAADAGLATTSFLRLFAAQVGEPPQRYLLRRRLDRAANLLTQTDLSMDDIAEQCGFCDRNYFTSRFSRLYGRGPATYRRHGKMPMQEVPPQPYLIV